MLTVHNRLARRQSGVTLIELLIGLALGLIVVTGVISFIGSLLATNTQTTQITLLNQELRTVTELIARDIRRSRGQADPLANVGEAGDAIDTWDDINTTTAGCILYGYEQGVGGAFRSVRLEQDDGIGAIVMAIDDAATTCASAGDSSGVLTSDRVDIDTLTFTLNGNRVDITVTGSWRNGAQLQPRTYTTSVFIRSGTT